MPRIAYCRFEMKFECLYFHIIYVHKWLIESWSFIWQTDVEPSTFRPVAPAWTNTGPLMPGSRLFSFLRHLAASQQWQSPLVVGLCVVGPASPIIWRPLRTLWRYSQVSVCFSEKSPAMRALWMWHVKASLKLQLNHGMALCSFTTKKNLNTKYLAKRKIKVIWIYINCPALYILMKSVNNSRANNCAWTL